MLSETRIAEIQSKLLQLYEEIENDLLVNVAKQISVKEPQDINTWYTDRLTEISSLDRKNQAVIAKYAERTTEEVESLFRTMAIESVENDEKLYVKAIREGLIQETIPIADSPAINRIIATAARSADDVINLVGTTAVEAANQGFRNIVNTAFIQVDGGILSYQTATRQAVNKLADIGITGQTYRVGDKTIRYSIDAAVRREIVTSSLQTAREVQDERQSQYGVDLIEVTSHVGARPKCAKDQGKIYSNSGDSDEYPARSTTSEGEPDGLFGVNCRHQYFPFFPGLSTQRFKPEPAGKNEKIYEESQKQRYLEREVRKEKRRLIIADSRKDVDGFDQSSVKLKKKEQALKDFMEKTGRTQRPRTQEPGFNRSLSQKAVAANKRAGG